MAARTAEVRLTGCRPATGEAGVDGLLADGEQQGELDPQEARSAQQGEQGQAGKASPRHRLLPDRHVRQQAGEVGRMVKRVSSRGWPRWSRLVESTSRTGTPHGLALAAAEV
jgi:hypothetical protein